MGYGELELAGLLVNLAEVVVNRRIGAAALHGLMKILRGFGVLAKLEVDPAEGVEEGVVLRV